MITSSILDSIRAQHCQHSLPVLEWRGFNAEQPQIKGLFYDFQHAADFASGPAILDL